MKKQVLYVMAVLCGLSGPAAAELEGFDASFEYGYQRVSHNWRAYTQNNDRLVNEEGLLNRDYLALRANFNDRLIILFDANITAGYIDFDGQTLGGFALQTTTDIDAESFRLGFQAPVSTAIGTLLPTASYQINDWQRNLLAHAGTSAAELDYDWPQWGAGVELHSSILKGELQVSVMGEWSTEGHVDVDYSSAGLRRTRLKLGHGDGFTAAVRYVFPVTVSLRLVPQAGYQLWQWEASELKTENAAVRYTVQEPESEAEQYFVGLAIQFFYD